MSPKDVCPAQAEGDYIAACQAYEKAVTQRYFLGLVCRAARPELTRRGFVRSQRDLDAVVRLNLDHMRNPQHAMQVVRETRSTEVQILELTLRRNIWARTQAEL